MCRGHHSENKGTKEEQQLREMSHLLLEETSELVHHAAAAAAVVAGRGTTIGTAGMTGMTGAGVALVLLDGIFSDAADDGSTDCSEDAVVGLVARETTRRAASEGAGKTTLTLLGITGSLLLVISVVRLLAWTL